MRWLRFFLCLVGIVLVGSLPAAAQPFDLIVPDESVGDSLSTELRRLQAIERDISLEKLTQAPTKLEALIELGDLRLSQGKLEEAERFYEMALEMQPENMLANKGLALVYYHQGKFGKTKAIFDRLTQLYPLSEALHKEVDRVRNRLSSSGELGLRIFEDNRGFQEVVSHLEAFFPSFTYPRLSARYRFETWQYQEGGEKLNSKVLASTFEYVLSRRSRLALTYAPETITDRSTIGAFTIHGVTGTDQLHLAALTGRTAFKDNLTSAKRALAEDYGTLVLFGDLHERARIIQSITAGDISDGNARRRFETEVLYFLQRRGIPLLSVNAKISSTSFERQFTKAGAPYVYWAPTDFRAAQVTLSWERGIGGHWWWGAETSFISNSYRDAANPDTRFERGFGFGLHAGYRFETGRLHAEFGDTIQDYYRQRRLGVFGSFDF
ncbi:MAG: tetratricopeptide repeat protein [Candidatus Riflebacteria bacterium]|nr:tetratricopeptide repeat protein [Candidatus Riflebacteria bacterium]